MNATIFPADFSRGWRIRQTSRKFGKKFTERFVRKIENKKLSTFLPGFYRKCRNFLSTKSLPKNGVNPLGPRGLKFGRNWVVYHRSTKWRFRVENTRLFPLFWAFFRTLKIAQGIYIRLFSGPKEEKLNLWAAKRTVFRQKTRKQKDMTTSAKINQGGKSNEQSQAHS